MGRPYRLLDSCTTCSLLTSSMVLFSWLSLPAWQKEFELLSPDINVVVLIGDNRSRQKVRDAKEIVMQSNVGDNGLICIYQI